MHYYEERYRLTGRALAGRAASARRGVIGCLWPLPVIFLPLGHGHAVLTAQGAGVIDRVRRTMAFRADEAGITLGAVPDKLTVRRGSRLFIPWADVERIILYPVRPRGRGGRGSVRCIGVQRRASAKPLPWGNEQAPGCPVPGVPAWATRMVTGWRLDRDRLAAVTAEAAPGIPIVDTTVNAHPTGEGPGQENGTAEAGPAA